LCIQKPNGSKQIPVDVANYLTPISLGYWLADDGAKHGKGKGREGVMLNTNSYDKVQVEQLSSALNQVFGLSSTVYAKRGRTTIYYTIYIPSRDMPKLQALILPYLHSSMYYKVGLISKYPLSLKGLGVVPNWCLVCVSASSGPHKGNLVVSTGYMLESP
jgi:hypothetical protein